MLWCRLIGDIQFHQGRMLKYSRVAKGLCNLHPAVGLHLLMQLRAEEPLPEALLNGATLLQAVAPRVARGIEKNGIHHGMINALVLLHCQAVDQ